MSCIMFLHDYLSVCEIYTVRTIALNIFISILSMYILKTNAFHKSAINQSTPVLFDKQNTLSLYDVNA